MNTHERNRAHVMRQLDEGRMTQRDAATQLALSVRHVKRLLNLYRQDGDAGLVSKQRGRTSNHQLAATTRQRALSLLQTHYADFGPTFAHEKLTEVHHLALGRETVRRLMIHAHLWQPRRARKPVIHPLRERRARRGELVQIDGSPFAWFEDRAPACMLLVYIDDATGQLMHLQFTAAESTFSYFQATETYLRCHGKPLAFYSDKLSVFRISQRDDGGGHGLTQFTRAMTQLGIEVLCANSPQAKGRVERVNQTLQDRLVKEMRLRQIANQDAGNQYLPEFMHDFNRRFAVVPRAAEDAHRPVLPHENLARILTIQEPRVLSKNLTVQYDNVIYQIQTARPTYALRHATVRVCENVRGEITIEYKGKPLPYTVYRAPVKQAQVVTSKQLNLKLDALAPASKPRKPRKPHIPAPDHPWR
jgi:transposase